MATEYVHGKSNPLALAVVVVVVVVVVAAAEPSSLLAFFPSSFLQASNKLYGGSITQFGKTIRKFGWECVFVDFDDLRAVADAVSDPDCRAVWCESLVC